MLDVIGLNLALVFLCILCCCTFLLIGEYVLCFVFPYQAKRLSWGTSPKWPILCRIGNKTLTSNQSVCLSTRMSHKWQVQTSQNFLYVLPVVVAWSYSDDIVICYVLLLFWMMSCFAHSRPRGWWDVCLKVITESSMDLILLLIGLWHVL